MEPNSQSNQVQRKQLPQSDDIETWDAVEDSGKVTLGEKRRIDMRTRSPILCGNSPQDHSYSIDPEKREVTCEKCGQGFKFLVSDVVYKNGELYAARDFKYLRKGERIA